MALLSRWVGVALIITTLVAGGCSLLLDPDDLDEKNVGDTDATETSDTGLETDTVSGFTVTHSGQNGCTLAYVSMLGCPATCPSSGGWPLEFAVEDVQGSVSWRFSVTNQYRIGATASGASVTVDLDVPAGCLPTKPITVAPGEVIAELAVDGGAFTEVARFGFAVESRASCGSDIGSCGR
jgi:hypothetical protein